MNQIREATAEDASLIQSMAEEIWYPTYSPILSQEQIRYMLDYIYDLQTITSQIVEKKTNLPAVIPSGTTCGFLCLCSQV